MAEVQMVDADERRALIAELEKYNFRVSSPDRPLFSKEPNSTMVPVLWKAADIAAQLDQIGARLKLQAGGARRTLQLSNPGLPYGTTPTFWVSIQYILPGEIATAHRHMASALRFIMQGEGADTTVDGEMYQINEGDLVLTPNWTWHDHEHKGSEPMVWIDVLDISLVRSCHAVFFEDFDMARQTPNVIPDESYRRFGSGLMRPQGQPERRKYSPVLAYTRAMSEEALRQAAGLDPDPFDDVILEYQNPVTGEPALPTIGTRLQMLRPGTHTRAHRHTGSAVYYVIRGEGATIINGQRYDWAKGDFLALPPWATHEHLNTGKSEVLLFQVNDLPALEKLGFYREEPV